MIPENRVVAERLRQLYFIAFNPAKNERYKSLRDFADRVETLLYNLPEYYRSNLAFPSDLTVPEVEGIGSLLLDAVLTDEDPQAFRTRYAQDENRSRFKRSMGYEQWRKK